MLKVEIPGKGRLALAYLVLDYNGTLACDGAIKAGALSKLRELLSIVQSDGKCNLIFKERPQNRLTRYAILEIRFPIKRRK